ncbi:MAG: trimeric autotransporter adhesin [Gaiellales bacterium]|jgi:hypothetical protein|nr:trimeric autotransporter adhesin [Gaiellales bacterium]
MKTRFHVRPLALVLTAAVAAIAAFSTSAAGAGGPANTAPPTVSGTAKAGETLTAKPGTWSDPAATFAYAWQRCNDTGTACATIAGATATTYVPGSADVGQTDRVLVTATNAGGTTDAPSAATAVVAAGAAPQNTGSPTVSGTPTEGQTLVGSDGTWAGAATIAFAYAWSRCDATGGACVPITGATAKTYVLATADVDKTVRLAVTAKNALGSDTETSIPTAVIERLAPASVVTLASGAKSVDATDVKLPSLLVIDKVSFSPNPLRSRAAFTARIHVSDTRGYSVRNVLVFVQGLPFGRSSTPAEVRTGSDGTATLTLQPTHKLPLQRGASLVMFVRARVAGDKLIAGVAARRLVNVRVVPS